MILSFLWRKLLDPDPASSYVALLGAVRLSGLRVLPTFLRFGVHIERQLKRTPGVIGSRVGADVARLTFFHLSAWSTSEAIQGFVNTSPHHIAVERLTGRPGETAFRYWTVRGSKLPMHFSRELHRLSSASPNEAPSEAGTASRRLERV